MALTPRERADFDEIVAQLRFEEVKVGAVEPKRLSIALLVSVSASLAAFALGIVVLVRRPEVAGPIMVATAILISVLVARRALARSRL
jgi:hypothetical protein